MLQLRETLKIIEEQYEMDGYFAAVRKNVLFSTAIDHQDRGGFTL